MSKTTFSSESSKVCDDQEVQLEEFLIQMLVYSKNDLDYFNSIILDRPPFCDYQKQWCQDLMEYRCLAVETGNQTGKDYWIGCVVPWWLATRPESLVVVTGPGQTTLGSVTWKEIRRAVEGSAFLEIFKPTVSIGIKTSPHTVRLNNGSMALGFSTTNIERASGQHAGELLVVVEEASGLSKEIWDAVESFGYSKLIAIGNPLRADGGFVDLCNRAARDRELGIPRAQSTIHRNVPSTASPHAAWEKSPVGLADRTWIEATRRNFGADSLYTRIHIDAIRPSLSNEQLISKEDLDRCTATATIQECSQRRAGNAGGVAGVKRIGCDVGEGVGRARTVIFVRDDLGILECHSSRYTNARDAAEIIARLAAKHGVYETNISYDRAGEAGKKLNSNLDRLGFKGAREYRGGGNVGFKYAKNNRTGCACAFARRLDPDFSGRNSAATWKPFAIEPGEQWPLLRAELLELRYHLLGSDLTSLETKEDMSERLGRSPDFADAITQTFACEAVRG